MMACTYTVSIGYMDALVKMRECSILRGGQARTLSRGGLEEGFDRMAEDFRQSIASFAMNP